MIDMTTQNCAELKALKKQLRALQAEDRTLAKNSTRALNKIQREIRKAENLARRNGSVAFAQVMRETKAGKKRLEKTAACIARRIAVLGGRN